VSLYHGEYNDQLLWQAGWLACWLAPSQILDEIGMIFSGTQLVILLELQQNSDLFLISIFTMAAACFLKKKTSSIELQLMTCTDSFQVSNCDI
jgi:hypothetical protein